MRPSKFSEEEMLQALRQVDAGTPAVEVCRRIGITQTTFYRWRKKHGVSAVAETRGMRALQTENRKLKQIVADLLIERLD